jgi:glycosyltransferase involved in cell wall biosynthesis
MLKEIDNPMISVVICTRNRSESLGRTLESINQLFIPEGLQWELIVVDNNSTDSTRIAVERFEANSPLDVRYVLEPRRGASQARNTGMQKARGEIVALTDDDMIVDERWLAQIVKECSDYPSVPLHFGQTRTVQPGQAKIAIKEGDSEETYVFPCGPADPGSSNNMILRKAILSSVGDFDTTLGAGGALRAAEDIDLTYRVLRSGGTVRYCPSILAYHDHNRQSSAQIRSLLFDYGVGIGGFYCKHALKRDLWAIKLCYWEIKAFLRVLFKRGEVVPVFLHLAGMLTGFWWRLGIEAKTLLNGVSASEWSHTG